MITVIMSTYNESIRYISEAIESILNQTYRDFEFIIVNDNPENKSLANILNKYRAKDNRIKVIDNELNVGLTASLNRALSIAKGDIIVRMDADDVSLEHRIEEQLLYMQSHDLDIIGCELQRIDENGVVIDNISNKSYNSECISRLLRLDNCVAHPTWMVKKDIYVNLNGYREIKACEDYDFLLRALRHNYKIGIVDKVLFQYRINSKGISQNNAFRQMMTGHYLQKNYENIDAISQKDIDEFLSLNNSKEESEKYAKAYALLNRYIGLIKQGRKKYYIMIPILGLKSKYIAYNFYKILKMRIIKNIYA